jgi:hypothetical protein
MGTSGTSPSGKARRSNARAASGSWVQPAPQRAGSAPATPVGTIEASGSAIQRLGDPEVDGVDDRPPVDGLHDRLAEAHVGEAGVGQVEPVEQLGLERHEGLGAEPLGGHVDPRRRHQGPVEPAGLEVVEGDGEVVVLPQVDLVDVGAAGRRPDEGDDVAVALRQPERAAADRRPLGEGRTVGLDAGPPSTPALDTMP